MMTMTDDGSVEITSKEKGGGSFVYRSLGLMLYDSRDTIYVDILDFIYIESHITIFQQLSSFPVAYGFSFRKGHF